MPADLNFLKTLEAFMGQKCKVVYRDGGAQAASKAFYGKLIQYDGNYSVWRGGNTPQENGLQVAFNHADINRIVMEVIGT